MNKHEQMMVEKIDIIAKHFDPKGKYDKLLIVYMAIEFLYHDLPKEKQTLDYSAYY